MLMCDNIVTCPYDVTHRIRRSKLSYHLVRCRRNHLLDKVQCPFNACHLIDDATFESHVLTCPSNGNVQRYQYTFEPSTELGTVSLETVKKLHVPIMKDWIEENVPTYDPWKNTQDRNIIRCLIGGTKSEKKKFKLAERQRLTKLKEWNSCRSNLHRNFKRKPTWDISKLSATLKILSIDEISALLKSIDMSKLYISENIVMKGEHLQGFIEQVKHKAIIRLRIFMRLWKIQSSYEVQNGRNSQNDYQSTRCNILGADAKFQLCLKKYEFA